MSNLTISELFKDSFKFTIRNFYAVIMLGLILSLLAFLEFYYDFLIVYLPFISIICIIGLFFISFIEAGFCYRIYVNSIKRLNTIDFKNFKQLIHHGIVDFTVTAIYVIAMLAFDQIAVYLLGLHYSNLFMAGLILIFVFLVSNFVNVYWFLALLNLAYNDGKFSSAFNFKQIHNLAIRMGFTKYCITFFGCAIMDFFLSLNIFGAVGMVPVVYIDILLINFIVTPFIVIFLKRFTTLASLEN